MNLRQQASEPCTSVAKKSRTLTSASLARRSCIYPSVVSLPSAPRGLHEAPRLRGPTGWVPKDKGRGRRGSTPRGAPVALPQAKACLLYTSDAADDLLCVDLGGRRIIKTKKTNHNSQKPK